MQLLETIVLGLVEGITEFLPVSSTGHLILASHLMGDSGQVVEAFEVFIQLGAILAVVWLYGARFRGLLRLQPGPGFQGRRGILLLAITTLPILMAGFFLKDFIKGQLFQPVVVVWALGLGGVAILILERLPFSHDTTDLDTLTWRQALLIGLFQCLAVCPGVSRAAATIMGGMFSGLDRSLAAEYSFFAAVPVMLVVSLHDLLEIWHQLNVSDMLLFALGFGVSFVSAVVAVKLFIRLLQHTTLAPFGVYRIVLAVVYFVFFVRPA